MGEVILQGPLPSSALGFCFVCAGMVKHAAIQGVASEIREHEASNSQLVRRFPVHGTPQPAVAWGLVPGTQIVSPLCWTHLMPVETSTSGLIRAQGPLPQANGPVLLDGTHRPPS